MNKPNAAASIAPTFRGAGSAGAAGACATPTVTEGGQCPSNFDRMLEGVARTF